MAPPCPHCPGPWNPGRRCMGGRRTFLGAPGQKMGWWDGPTRKLEPPAPRLPQAWSDPNVPGPASSPPPSGMQGLVTQQVWPHAMSFWKSSIPSPTGPLYLVFGIISFPQMGEVLASSQEAADGSSGQSDPRSNLLDSEFAFP